ncbi:MAG: nickel pincer cofactor biosynthesis protein LarC [Opitutales bacterium]|jgi:uncharacterized protein (TIGR00299 family) protein
MTVLYYNCPAGLCGDMNLGAMVDLGVNPQDLLRELEKLGLDHWQVSFHPDARKGVSGTRCDVTYEEAHHHHHHHGHEHHHHHEHHPHRTFREIREIIGKSGLRESVKADAIAVFGELAEAEGAVHGKPAEEVHFHEVGAIDSIIDIVGAAICWDLLGIRSIAASTIELGGGTVKCAHGIMPVPAPATARLVRNFPVSLGGTSKEATTPTGAALLAGKKCVFGKPVQGKVLATGAGIGQRDDPDMANVVYVTLIDPGQEAPGDDKVVELVTNLDDMSPEHVAFLVEQLMEAGVLDAWQSPATFKKGRLGCVLSVLIEPASHEAVTELLFLHSTTLGIRWREWNRSVLSRRVTEKETPLGTVRVKSVVRDGKVIRSKPEYDDLCRIARENNLSLTEVEQQLDL